MPKKKSVFVDMLVEGRGGELIFAPVEAAGRNGVKKLLQTKNSMVRENLKRELKEKR